jgi:hypothetical protein
VLRKEVFGCLSQHRTSALDVFQRYIHFFAMAAYSAEVVPAHMASLGLAIREICFPSARITATALCTSFSAEKSCDIL